MAKAFGAVAATTALVLLGVAAYVATDTEVNGAPPPGGAAAPQRGPVASAAADPRASSPPPVAGISSSERPYELDELLRQSKLGEGWLTAHGFSSGRALQGLHALLDARTNLPGEPRLRLGVHPSGGAEGENTVAPPRLASGERYVLATLASPPPTGEDSVLIRWRRISDDTVMELSAQALPPVGESLHLWMHTTQDWAPGRYRLEVIGANARLAPLAAADFEIVAPDAEVTPFAYPVQVAPQR